MGEGWASITVRDVTSIGRMRPGSHSDYLYEGQIWYRYLRSYGTSFQTQMRRHFLRKTTAEISQLF